jgi:hypothetical protein
MASTLSPMRSRYPADRWPDSPSANEVFHAADLDRRTRRPARQRRPMRALFIFCLGVAATLAWQSHQGDMAREMIASQAPQLAWLAPQGPAQAAPDTVASAGPRDVQQLKTMSLDLAAVRQSLSQLAADQQRMADGITRLQDADQDILNKISVASPKPAVAPAPAAAPARKPTPAAPATSSQVLPLAPPASPQPSPVR